MDTHLSEPEHRCWEGLDMPLAEAICSHPMEAGEAPFGFLPFGKANAHVRRRRQEAQVHV